MSTQSHEEPVKPWDKRKKKLKDKVGPMLRKTGGIDWGHPQAVSRIGENRAIPLSDRCMASGGERKPPLIARHRSRKSTARNVRMVLDLGDPDRAAEIAPDGKLDLEGELSADI